MGQVAHHRIVFGSDTCASGLFGDERVFSEKVTWSQRPNENVPLFDRILDKHLQLTSFDEIESVTVFSLIDQGVFRIQQLQGHGANKEVDQNLVLLKNEAFKGLVVENELDYLVLKRRRKRLKEELEFQLTILELLRVLEVAHNILLELIRHVHVLHGSVREVD